ncbi:YraN family protein [Rhodohalobacter halophilus]|uniref:YraN family protein n=1 Tax=Rhodohalobacter halophilus TaxID=1812810 RepID=UPI00083FAC70|nr:YraN family protein [Rhodohalobacter halophilus]
MTQSNRDIGNRGEDIAAAYLESKDWLIFDRNYFFEKAEVDIVATDRNYIVFVEVKFRSSTYFGEPEDSITPEKELNIRKAAEAWLYERKMETAVARFDVISIVQKKNEAPEIKHFKDVFR